ncbi:MAG: NADH-quinone oxidoreductase subunit J [Planctomycetota bacterium]
MFSHVLEVLVTWTSEHRMIVVPLLLGFLAYLSTALGSRTVRFMITPVLSVIALYAIWTRLIQSGDSALAGFLFSIFAAIAVLSAFLMITQRDPVYAALWFAMVILSTCGLFLMQAASFLAAATIIVYAGAIIVTFLFVIMLAQQTELAAFNQHFRQPVVAGLAGTIFLMAVVHAIREVPTRKEAAKIAVAGVSTLSQSAGEKVGGVTDLGRTLFTDYLWGVELAGTLLLAATVGTILIANRPREAST